MQFDQFTESYIETALWASSDGDEPMDANHSREDLADETLNKMAEDCQTFQRENSELLVGLDLAHAGHDLWLTRNHHGAGFWDGDYPKDIGNKLTKVSNNFGECHLEVGDSGKIYIL